MRIVWLELQKIIRSPIIWLLLIVFTAFNIYFIFSNMYVKDELKIANDIVEKYGVTFDDSTLEKMEKDLQSDLVKIEEDQSVETFLNELTYEIYNAKDDETKKAIDEIAERYAYLVQASNLEQRYAKIDVQELQRDILMSMELTGPGARIVERHFEKVDQRLNEFVNNEEYKQWFFAGNPYRMHSHLFRSIFKMIALEGTILVVLMTAFLVCYEQDHRTSLVVYSTKKGRTVQLSKWFASMIASVCTGVFILVLTLGVYFSVYDYSGLWSSSVSSGLNWEHKLPYVLWWDMSYLTYVIFAIGIVISLWLIIATCTFVTSVLLQNSYITMISMFLLLVAIFIVPSALHFSSLLLVIAHFNITLLLLNPHMYFNSLAGLIGFRYFEVTTLVTWTIFAGVLLLISYRYFHRKDLH